MNTILSERIRTSGEFPEEPLAWELFDSIVENSQAFRIYREVSGEYIHPRTDTEVKGARIDRVLFPLPKIVQAGWRLGGAIGIEGKCSGKKIGPLVCQALDYTRCAFKIESAPGNLIAEIVLRWIFIYPVDASFGELASVMANNRIGTCFLNERGGVSFSCNGTNAITINQDGSVSAKDLSMGRKRGSR